MPDEVYIDSKAPSNEAQWLLMNAKIKHVREIADMETRHLMQMQTMIQSMNEKALDKAFNSMADKQEQANHKYTLLKEQAASFATHEDLKALEKQMAIQSKMIYIALGVLIAIQFYFNNIAK